MLQLIVHERKFQEGKIGDYDTKILGKPENQDKRLQKVFELSIKDIDNDDNPILKKLFIEYSDINDLTKTNLKTNMKEYLKSLSSTLPNDTATPIQELSNSQQNYIQFIRKLNYVNTKSDGKIGVGGTQLIYNLTPTDDVSKLTVEKPKPLDTYSELQNDFDKINLALTNYLNILEKDENGILPLYYGENGDFKPANSKYIESYGKNPPNKRFFLLMSRILIDKNKKQDFISKIIKGGLKDVKKLESRFENVVDDLGKKLQK